MRTFVDGHWAFNFVLKGASDLDRQRCGKMIVKYLHDQPIRPQDDRIVIGIHRHHPHGARSHRQPT
jgi:hypothetical protein